MSSFFALVKFSKDGTFIVVRSNDVRGLEGASHPDDYIPGQEYMVFWQDGTESFDGSFPAKIICAAATLPELREKAKTLGIRRMPPSFATLMEAEAVAAVAAKADDKDIVKETRRDLQKNIGESRRQRMKDNLKIMEGEKSSLRTDGKEKKKESLDSKIVINRKRNCSEKKGAKDVDHDKKRSKEKQHNLRNGKSDVNVLESKDKKNELAERKGAKEDVKDDTKRGEEKRHNSRNEKTEVNVVGTKDKKIEVVDDERFGDEKKLGGGSSFHVQYEGEMLSGWDSEGECGKETASQTIKSDNGDDLNATVPIFEQKAPSKYVDESDGADSDLFMDGNGSSNSDDSSGKLIEEVIALKKKLASVKIENEALRACSKLSEESRLSCMDLNSQLEAKVQSLKDEIRSLKDEMRRLKRNRANPYEDKMKRLLTEARDLLDKGLQCCSSPDLVNSVSTSGGKVKKALFLSDDSAVNVSYHNIESHSSFLEGQPSASSSPLGKKRGDEFPDEQPARKKTKQSDQSTSGKHPSPGLSHKEIVEISETVRRDILNEKPLERDEQGRVKIGKDIILSEKKWMAIKSQPKNSLFVTKLASTAYGTAYLKERTVGVGKKEGKKMATPSKVDHFVAALRGKLLAADPKMPNIEEAAATAKKILSQKMQDDARPPRQSAGKEKK